MIEEPARAAGLTFGRDAQGVGLHERILEEAQGQADVLPLLEFSQVQLDHERDLSQRQLTYVAYQRMGGLKEALGEQAEATVQALGADGEAAFAGAMRPLVRIDPNNKAQSQPAPRSAFTTPAQQRLVDALIEARLLVAEGADTTPAATPTDPTQDAQASQPTSGPELPHDTNITQEARIKLAHEALLTHWGRLKAWLDDNRDFLRWRGRVEEEARRWEEEGSIPARLLPAGKPLAEALSWQQKQLEDLAPPIHTYIDRSQRYAKRKRRQLYSLVTLVIAVGFVVAASFSIKKQQENLRQQYLQAKIALAQDKVAETTSILDTAIKQVNRFTPASLITEMQRLRYKAGLSRGIIAKGDFQPTHNDALSDTSDFYGAPTLLSGDGQFAVTVGSVLNWDSEPHWDSMISVFELNSGRVLLSRTENSIAYNYFLSAHGEKLVYQAGDTIKIIDTASNQDIKSIQLSGNWILVPMSGSNQFLAFAEGSNAAAIYNMDTGDLLATIESTSHANIKRFFKAEAITGSPIAILFEDGQLYLYDGSRSKLSRLPVPEGHNIHDLFYGSQATGTLFAILDRKTYAAYRWPYEVPQIYEFDSQIIALTDDANGSIAVVRQDDPTTVYFLNKRAEEISSSKSLPTGILGIFAAGANTALVQSETYNTYFVTPDQSLLYFGGRFNVSADDL